MWESVLMNVNFEINKTNVISNLCLDYEFTKKKKK